jgi:hypothetical protein
MTHFAKIVIAVGLLHSCLAPAQSPLAPRTSATAYPASKVQPLYSIGVRELSKTEVRNTFATPLADRYVVVEVGFFPANGKSVQLLHSDFALRAADGTITNPASPATVAAMYQKRPEASRDVVLYPTANVGYASGPAYDGTGRRVSGPVVGAGMGVGVENNTSPATSDADRQTMETELAEKELKNTEVSSPVSGYLYFPITSRRKGEAQLEYHGTSEVTNLPLKSH